MLVVNGKTRWRILAIVDGLQSGPNHVEVLWVCATVVSWAKGSKAVCDWEVGIRRSGQEHPLEEHHLFYVPM